jgi:DNA repair exonuclease SbcCD ATPase subunit
MILFSVIRWKNLLSTGDAWTEVNFRKSKSTLIVGENGAGKSTILDAICFALFAKPFRKINKPQLVNSINKKGMLVELEFSIGTKQYLIRRGHKPNVFDIICDGNALNQTSDVREYQEMLESNILKLNFKSFSQIVILGSASFTPFMQLPAAHRREIIEDLLDIQIFSIMNTLLKEKVALNKQEITSVSYEMKAAADKIELHNKLVKTLKDNKQVTIDAKNNQLKDVIGNMRIALDVIKEHKEKIITLKGSIIDEDTVSNKYQEYVKLKRAGENKLRTLSDSIEFLEEHESCPTCSQDIDAHFKYRSVGEKTVQKADVEKTLASLQKLMDSLDERLVDIAEVHSLIQEQQNHIQDCNTQVKIYENTIKLLQDEVTTLESEIEVQSTDDAEELDAIKRTLKAAINTKEELLKDKSALDVAAVLLKDSGVKTKIIKQYIPVINKLVNKYLAAMDFFVNFELNENFEETIKSRHRDDFCYESFSEGEKMRIDLALLFTWRAISKLRNSASTNLLIMDEVFDSSLDNNGTEEFLKIISTLTADTNLFIISHKGDQLFDKFHSVIKFQKVKNFSQMVK